MDTVLEIPIPWWVVVPIFLLIVLGAWKLVKLLILALASKG